MQENRKLVMNELSGAACAGQCRDLLHGIGEMIDLGVDLFAQILPDGVGHFQEDTHDFRIKLAAGEPLYLFAGYLNRLGRAIRPV
jgi:hypothetical protein